MTAPTVDDVKTHLNITGTTDDAELQHMLDAASDRISYEVGPLAPVSFTEDHIETAPELLVLRRQPVQSLTSVTEQTLPNFAYAPYGQPYYVPSTYNTTDTWLLSQGMLYRRPLFTGQVWHATWQTTVTYVAGWSPLPEDLRLAVLELVRHFWLTQQGSRARSNSDQQMGLRGNQEMLMQAMSYSLPNRVKELLEPYRQRTRAA